MHPSRRATYRLQLRPGFGYREVAAVAPYLARLGISHVYTSPYLAAAPGSTHGYDVVDHTRVNEELGSPDDLARMRDALRAAGLRELIDVVPNHMAVGTWRNAWWWDVLENGRASRYADHFDVDWDPPESKLRDQVLLPVLGDHYGRVLEAREITIEDEGGRARVRYHEHLFPLAPGSLDDALRAAGGDRARAIAAVNVDADALDEVLSRQHYRLASWRVAGQELDYRRFFDVTELAALRLEREEVFRATHALVLGWAARGEVDGVRVDHPDGLRDPHEYFERVRSAAPATWLLAEKILQPGEHLPAGWPVDGTTGYEFLNTAGGVFVDRAAESDMTALYHEVTGDERTYADVLHDSKVEVMCTSLAADLERLVAFFVRVCESRRRFRDFTRVELRDALRETVACFPVYRTYVRAEVGSLADSDRAVIERAVAEARRRSPSTDPELFDLLRDMLLLRVTGPNETGVVMRLQQYAATTMAKGAEDTAFYRYLRLVSLNEVGGDPGRFGRDMTELHEHNAYVAEHLPETLLATSTHDTKRSEDVRQAIALLAQRPEEWRAAVARWHDAAVARGAPAPDAAMEYLFYQTVVGTGAIAAERLTAYMEKAAREAKVRTSWTRQDDAYEEELRSFVVRALGDDAWRADLGRFVASRSRETTAASLALTLLKLTSPGVPDIYQGTELGDDSLVDPDNRRAVDFAARDGMLAELATASACDAADDLARAKLFVVSRALALRSRRPDAFAGAYEPLEHATVASYRRGDDVVVAAPTRFFAARHEPVCLPAGAWRDVFTGERHDGGAIDAHALFAGFPVALLERA